MTATITPYRSELKPTRDGFAQLLWAEWSKFWTVRRWVAGMVLMAAVTVTLSVLGARGGGFNEPADVHPTIGPSGLRVNDNLRFIHQPLVGDGTITARVTSIKSSIGSPETWAKAGVMIKESTKDGSPYASVLATPGHGVRLQWDFTHDKAGSSRTVADSPLWLRLTRSGSLLTGYESADGTHWVTVGSVHLHGLPQRVQAGIFATTPNHRSLHRQFGSTSEEAVGRPVTATFDQISLDSGQPQAAWTSTEVGLGKQLALPDAKKKALRGLNRQSDGVFTVTGAGDVGPWVAGGSDTVQMRFQGVFVGLLFAAALGALFITAEYRGGMIRTTLTASPRRGRMLLAKALVIGAVTFVAGLIATTTLFPLAGKSMRSHGFRPPSFPDYALTDGPALRAVIGSAALLALVAVLALALGTLLRHSAAAITAVIVLTILPQILSFALPLTAAQWLLRVTPTAGFAIQQSLTHYPQVTQTCLPEDGCYPLSPWNGFAVLCAYVFVALGLAVWQLRKRDV